MRALLGLLRQTDGRYRKRVSREQLAHVNLPDRSVGMMIGMTRKKIAVSLPAELVEAAQAAVLAGRAASVSAYVADAIENKSKLDDLRALLDEMLEETGGPLTDEERTWADEILDAPSRKP